MLGFRALSTELISRLHDGWCVCTNWLVGGGGSGESEDGAGFCAGTALVVVIGSFGSGEFGGGFGGARIFFSSALSTGIGEAPTVVESNA
jgi:hypothetical protein